MTESELSPEAEAAIARFGTQVPAVYKRWARGAHLPAELDAALTELWISESVRLSTDDPARHAVARSFVGALFAEAGRVDELMGAPPTEVLARCAVQAYGDAVHDARDGKTHDGKPGAPWRRGNSRQTMWEWLDADFPQVGQAVIADVRANGLAATCLQSLPACAEVRQMVTELRSGELDLDDELALLCVSTWVAPDEAGPEQFLDLMRRALDAVNIEVASACIRPGASPTESESAMVRAIAGEQLAAGDRCGRRLLTAVLLAAAYEDDDTVRALLAGVDRVRPVGNDVPPEEQLILRRGHVLALAAAAAQVVGEFDAAVRLAELHLEEVSDVVGWATAGDDVLALYLVGIHESEPQRRAELFAAATEIARHGNVRPLFPLVYFHAAEALLDTGGDAAEVVRNIGYGRYLELVADHPEGHFWWAPPIAEAVRRFPSGPLSWDRLARTSEG
ncbi:hypothetical protein GOARA_006_00510 [Gordonia araii NBRC 100433]|uniref:Uncharacterized protein n=1 Tax=Gordonia araii NBRC 100433 TaxID=1073574 RepID=G7GXG7_9ACTN|nr:hypothetical protein [Gordonia araii]NNG95922.1 hypothetical protein [Gordonia araii NBRC 100433]GAB08292.1 hypothetical protein GOARA_006_00510 [Gordonia araii NBRC 100433]